ncbi:hypothetical protein WM46_23075 [Citrobacter freundii complex sp. CFNIH2]|nr:hypothetical protein WM46_23075 [Citrobacter freundii complex sp. CFNIH2]
MFFVNVIVLSATSFSVFTCDIHHTFPAINHQNRLFCGTDHYCHSPFHFEVENNSLQTFYPRR